MSLNFTWRDILRTASVRDRYGPYLNGMSMLMARRQVEAGVPFTSVNWLNDY